MTSAIVTSEKPLRLNNRRAFLRMRSRVSALCSGEYGIDIVSSGRPPGSHNPNYHLDDKLIAAKLPFVTGLAGETPHAQIRPCRDNACGRPLSDIGSIRAGCGAATREGF